MKGGEELIMNRFTYVAADNSAGDSANFVARDEADPGVGGTTRDVYVKKVIFGVPANSERTMLHDAYTQPGHASGMGSILVPEVAWNFTQPVAAAGLDLAKEIDFTSGDGKGLRLNGGSIHTNSARVTVIWEPVEEAEKD